VTTSRPTIAFLTVVVVAAVAFATRPAAAQFDLSVERDLLVKLLRDGHYKQALAESRRVEESLVGRDQGTAKGGKKSKAQHPAVTVARVELLIYRGMVERRMGNLDAAEKALTDAYEQVMNPEFQALLRALAPTERQQLEQYALDLKLLVLQLIDNGTEVLIDRLRKFNYEQQALAAAGADAELSPEQRAEIESLFQRIDLLVRVSLGERQAFPTITKETPASKSPQTMMMSTLARPYRLIGMRYLEASRLSWTVPFDADPATMATDDAAGERYQDAGASRPGRKSSKPADSPPRPPETPVEREAQARSQRLRSVGYLEKSRDLAARAVETARTNAGLPSLKTKASTEDDAEAVVVTAADAEKTQPFRQEEARVIAETAIPLTVLAMLDGDTAAARTLIDPTLKALSSAESPTHPELARPLMISAELAMREGVEAQDRKEFAAAEKSFSLAVSQLRSSKSILESAESEFDPESPLHRVLADLLVKSEARQSQSRQVASATSVADAAARRALAALARSEATKAKPKPQGKPDAKPDDGAPGKKPLLPPKKVVNEDES